MARRPAPSPLEIAIGRLAKLASVGTSPARMQRAARETVGAWRATEDPDIAKRWVETLHAEVAVGLAAAEEKAEDMDAGDAGATQQAKAVVEALRATVTALAAQLAGM